MVTVLLDKILSLGGLMKGGKRLSGFTLILVDFALGFLKSKYGVSIEIPGLSEAGMGLMAVGVVHDDVKDRIRK